MTKTFTTLKIILLLSFVVLSALVFLPNSSGQFGLDPGTYPMSFYLDGSGDLSFTLEGGGNEQSASFGPSLMIASSTTVGTWQAPPVVRSTPVGGPFAAMIFASGTGRARFDFNILVDGSPSGISFSSSTQTLSRSASPIIVTHMDPESTQLDEGSVLGLEITVSFTGTQGTVYWGSDQYPSTLTIMTDDSYLGIVRCLEDDKKARINATFFSPFGEEYLASYDLYIEGPSEATTVSEPVVETVDGMTLVTWEWDHAADKAEKGTYEATVSFETHGGGESSGLANFTIGGGPDETMGFEGDTVFLLAISGIVALIACIFFFKLFISKSKKGIIGTLRSNTDYFKDYRMLIVGETLSVFAWYLLLVISLFIFINAWKGWGDFLVGLNFGLYSTVSLLIFLGLAKASDSRGMRKNILLTLIFFEIILLFVMTGLSYIPTPVILIGIIMLFTLNTMCHYGAENLRLVLVTEYFSEEHRGKAFGLMRAIGYVIGGLGGVLSGFLFDRIGFWFCFLFAGFVVMISWAVTFRVQDVDIREETRKTIGDWLKETTQAFTRIGGWFGNLAQKLRVKTTVDYMFSFQKRKQMNMLFVTTLFTMIAYGMIVPFIIVFLWRERGESATFLAMVYAIAGYIILSPINLMLAGWLCDRITARKVYMVAILGYIINWTVFNLAILLTTNNIIILVIYVFPIWPFMWIGFKLFVSDLTPRHERARGVTSIRLALGLGMVVGSIGGGLLLTFLSYETTFQLAILFTVVAAVMGFILFKMTRVVVVRENVDPVVEGERPGITANL